MNFIEHFNLFGVEAKQIPCIKGVGAPTNATEGAVGCFYMDTTNGDTYKCTAVTNGVYTWEPNDSGTVKSVNGIAPDGNGNVEIEVGGGSVEGAILYTPQTLTEEQKAQARTNIGAASEADILVIEHSPNLLNTDKLTDGAMNYTGNVFAPSIQGFESYQYTDFIPVDVGDVIVFQVVRKGYTNAEITSIRYIAAFDREKNVIPENGSGNAVNSYTVPDGVAYVRLSLATYHNMADPYVKQDTLMVHKGNSVIPYEPYWERTVLKPEVNNDAHIEQVVEGIAVLYTEQNLTDEQKAQARTNIGAAAPGEGGGGSADGAVLYTEQTLTPEQQSQAIENIGAVAAEDIFKKEYSTNLLNWDAVEEGATIDASGNVWRGADYATYSITALIPCKPGDKIRHQFDYNGVRYDNETTATKYTNIARIAAYDASGKFVTGSFKSPAFVYTVPDGASFVRIAFVNTQWGVTYKNHAIIIQDNATIVPYSEYGEILTKIIKPELDDRKIVLYSGQNLTGIEKAQARTNIGAASVADIYTGGLRAQIRQISFLDDGGYPVVFHDVYMPALDEYLTPQGQHRFYVYGLRAHSTTSKNQQVWQSKDGGETWSLFCSIPMDAANGIWYTDFAVDHRSNHIYLLKTTDGSTMNNNVVCTYYKASDGNWYARNAVVELGPKRWLSNNSFEIYTDSQKGRVAIFGEYGVTMDGTTYSLWRTTDYGTSWEKALEIQGNSNNQNNGPIRHWHTVKVDPYTKHLWAASGDNNATDANPEGQCRIYRSTDGGDNWELMFSGSQRERTCGFVFEQDCIYYGMDAKSWDSSVSDVTKIVKIDKSKLDTDRDNCREDVASVDCSRSIYGLTRTFYPDGMLVYTQHEPGAVITSDTYVLEFYDYATKRLYPVASFDISGISKDTYIGFYAGAKYQSLISGVIFAKPTNTMHQDKYGYTEVSKHIKINLTM